MGLVWVVTVVEVVNRIAPERVVLVVDLVVEDRASQAVITIVAADVRQVARELAMPDAEDVLDAVAVVRDVPLHVVQVVVLVQDLVVAPVLERVMVDVADVTVAVQTALEDAITPVRRDVAVIATVIARVNVLVPVNQVATPIVPVLLLLQFQDNNIF